MDSFCTRCRTIPCKCVDLCHGCDTPLPASHFCTSCGEVMEVYKWPAGKVERFAPELVERSGRRVAA